MLDAYANFSDFIQPRRPSLQKNRRRLTMKKALALGDAKIAELKKVLREVDKTNQRKIKKAAVGKKTSNFFLLYHEN